LAGRFSTKGSDLFIRGIIVTGHCPVCADHRVSGICSLKMSNPSQD
jgi:hypothetical protein